MQVAVAEQPIDPLDRVPGGAGKVRDVTAVFDVFMSPGSVTERLHGYTAEYDASDRVSRGGGKPEEGEDIEVLGLSFDEALAMCSDGRIRDAKTILLLQHADLHLFALSRSSLWIEGDA